MTRAELEKQAETYAGINHNKANKTDSTHQRRIGFLAGFLAMRDAAAEVAEKYENRNNSAACGLVKNEIKKLGEN